MEYMISDQHGDKLGKMTSNCVCVEINLSKGEVFTLFGGQLGASVQVVKGNLWITQEGDIEDHTLDEGQSHSVSHNGKVILQGLPAAHVRIVPAEENTSAVFTPEMAEGSPGSNKI